MKKFLSLALMVVFLTACMSSGTAGVERSQQEAGQNAILDNQPVPDLGGYSFERAVVIETYLARNRAINTYTYTLTETGILIEVCASKGYPIPYSTQLTNPLRPGVTGYADTYVIGNPEPNGLYSPDSAEATYILCINPDGSATPTYWEQRMFSLPYRIQADRVLIRDESVQSSFSINTP